MADALRPVPPGRLRHLRAERLLRLDLVDQAAQDDQLRWWHNRALHQAYGVIDGLGVAAVPDADPPTVRVSPGQAYDAHGRELVLRDERRLPVPGSAVPQCLVIGYHASHGVELHWMPTQQLTNRSGVPVSFRDADPDPAAPDRAIGQQDTTVATDPALRHAVPRSRPVARPRIGRGATISGRTPWRPWFQQAEAGVLLLGLEVRVDTSAAGFTDVPDYFVQITGTIWGGGQSQLPLLPFGHISEASKDWFVYRLTMPWLVRLLPRRILTIAARSDLQRPFRSLNRDLAINWIGVQSDDTLSPTFNRNEVLL